jgi:threonine/homoserine/homoserine lactone efflux protein
LVDTHFFAFAAVAALLVVSPGATMVVVADAAIQAGRRAGLWTVSGVGLANASMAVASALGLSALFARFPEVLHAVAAAGALYLAWLGIRALLRAGAGPKPRGDRRIMAADPCGDRQTPAAERCGDASAPATLASPGRAGAAPAAGDAGRWFVRGLVTNYSNPSVVLFYTVLVPQFITPLDRFVPRYLLLGGTHVAMSIVWLAAFAISVGTLARHMTRPAVRRAMDLVMGVTLLAFALKIATR